MLLNKDRALEVMDKYGLDALVATTPENVYYLSGYGTDLAFHFASQGFSAAIFPRDGSIEPTLVLQWYELPEIIERPTWMPGLRILAAELPRSIAPPVAKLTSADKRFLALVERASGIANRQRLLAQTLRELGLSQASLGFDDVRVMLDLRSAELSEAKLMDALNVFREIRVIKTPEEVLLLTRAHRLLEVALEGMAELCVEGTTARELLNYFRLTMALHGGYGSHAVWGGIDRPWLSYPNMEYRFKNGDVVYVDPAGHYKHYWADVGRTAVIGTPPIEFEERHATLQECHHVVVPMMKPGVSTATLKQAATETARRTMPTWFLPLVHSIGIEQYDHPQPLGDLLGEDFVIEEGMVVGFETLYLEIGWGLLQLEDTYHIQGGEARRLGFLSMDPLRPT